MTRRAALGTALAAVAGSLVALAPAAVAAPDGCSPSWRGGGGDWPTVGGNNRNTNFQPAERRLHAGNVARLRLRWTTSGLPAGQSTPTVAGTCVFFQGGGLISAVDVRTGAPVWQVDNDSSCTSGDLGSYCPFGVTIANGRVHADGAGSGKPFGSAYDQRTGRRLWKSKPVYFGYQANQLSSPKVAFGVHVTFTTGPDFDPGSRPGWGIFDERTGRSLVLRTTNPQRRDDDYLGGGIWSTASVDDNGYLYVGTSNPEEATADAAYDNSILKIDIKRGRRTFGGIVGHYVGDKDFLVGSGALDADFGAGPTLAKGPRGRQVAVAMQKSGTLHAVFTDTMKPAWTKRFPVSNLMTRLDGNSAMAGYDGKRLYVVANPGVLHALDPLTGTTLWSQPLTLEFYTPYRPTVVANGVVYTMRHSGSNLNNALALWNAATGDLIAEHPIVARDGSPCDAGTSGGLSVAHHMVLVNCGGFVAALGL